MIRLPLVVSLFIALSALGQKPLVKPYWQQKLVYNIAAKVLPQQHAIEGMLHLDYTNQSPDTLTFIWFHLWANAQANDSTAMAKQVAKLNIQSGVTQKTEGPGYISNLDWTVNGITAHAEKHSEWIDVEKLILPKPLPPGATTTIITPFNTVLPAYTFRAGYADSALFVAHWYPKPAVYDREGWHPMPYLEMGEYYSEFGKYTVDISLPSSYVVAATGNLQNADELQLYQCIGRLNRSHTQGIWQKKLNIRDTALQEGLISYKPVANDTVKTLRYVADSVHDFAFFTDPRFIIDYDTVRLSTGKMKDVFSFYRKQSFQRWNAAVEDATSSLSYYSRQVGDYPYKTLSVVEGPEGTSFAGIEYPTITLILTSPAMSDEATEQVIAHEIGHNWFYGMLASNERNFGWMDEGFNTFYELRYGIQKNRYISMLGPLSSVITDLPVESLEDYMYERADDMPCPSAINQPATSFTDFGEYYAATYIKTACWLSALERKLGKATFTRCMKAYYSKWRFRHPYPEDVQQVFEETSKQNLAAYFKQLTQPKQKFYSTK